MLNILLIGLVAGAITAAVLHFAYYRLNSSPRAQFVVFIGTLFVALLPGSLFGMADMSASRATWYWQADLSLSTMYILGWMSATFAAFALPHLLRMSRTRSR